MAKDCKEGGGTCIPLFGSIYCDCHGAFHGRFCEIPIKLIHHWCKKFNMFFERRLVEGTEGTAYFVCDPIKNIYPNNHHQFIIANFFEQIFILKVTDFEKITNEDISSIEAMHVPKDSIPAQAYVHTINFKVLRYGAVIYKAVLTDDYRQYTKGWSGYAIEMDGPYDFPAFNDKKPEECVTEARLLGAGASPFFGSAVVLMNKKQYKITTALERICKDEEDNDIFNPDTYEWKFFVFGNLSDFYVDFKIDDLATLKPTKTETGMSKNKFKLEDFHKPCQPLSLVRQYAIVSLEMKEKEKSRTIFGWMVVPECELPISYIKGGQWVYANFNEAKIILQSETYKNPTEKGLGVPSPATQKLEWSCTSDDSVCRSYCVDMKIAKPPKNDKPTWEFKIGKYDEKYATDCDIRIKLKTEFTEKAPDSVYETTATFKLKLRLEYDMPMFGIKCLRNCYWVDYDDLHPMMDPHEILFVQVTCFDDEPICTRRDEYVFNWGFIDNDNSPVYTDEIFHYMDEPNVAIIYKSYTMHEMPLLSIVLGAAKEEESDASAPSSTVAPTTTPKKRMLATQERMAQTQPKKSYRYQEVAEMKFDTQATKITRNVNPNETVAKYESCPLELTYRGSSFITEFELCIPDDSSRFTSFTYMFFQKFGDFTPGVMVAWGQSNYVTKIVLGASDLTSISVFRIQDATEIETEIFHDPIYVTPRKDIPNLRDHFSFIFKIFDGAWSRFMAVQRNIEQLELSELVQKYNAFFHEKQVIYFSRLDLELIYYIEDYQRHMTKILFNNMTNIEYTLSIEVLQITTMYHKALLFSTIPLELELLKIIPEKLQDLVKSAFKLLLPSIQETRMHRILEISSRLIEALAVCIYPNEDIFSKESRDAYTENLIKVADEPDIPMYLEPWAYDIDDYPYPELEEDDTKEMTKAAYKTMETVAALSHLVAVNLVPKKDEVLDEFTNFPGIIFERHRSKIDWSFYVNVKTGQKQHFIDLQQIGDAEIGVVIIEENFCKSQAKTFFSLQFIIAPFNPFYWTNKSRFIIKYPYMIKLTKNIEGLQIPENKRAAKKKQSAASTPRGGSPSKGTRTEGTDTLVVDQTRKKRALKSSDLETKNTVIEDEMLRVEMPMRTFKHNYTMGEAIYYHDEKKVKAADLTLSKFKLTIDDKTPSMLIWSYDLIDKGATINVTIEANGQSIKQKHITQNDRLILFDYKQLIPGAGPDTDIISVARPATPRNTMYGLEVTGVECLAWKTEEQTEWEPDCDSSKIEVNLIDNKVSCVCKTSETAIYAISLKPLGIKPDGQLLIDFKFDIQMCSICFLTCLIVFIMFLILLYMAIRLDNNDYNCRRVKYLIDNRECEDYPYVVIVYSGTLLTTSNIGIKIYGTCDNSKRHILRGIQAPLNGSTIEYYILTTDVSLGQLRAIELWTDYRGSRPEWYCEKIIIRNCNEKCEWEFDVNERFSLINDQFKDHHFIPLCPIKSKPSLCKQIFNGEEFILRHLWFGMLRRKWCHGFSRVEHVTCGFAVLFISMFFTMVIMGITSWSSWAYSDFCNICFFYASWVGLASLGASILVVYPFLYILRNSRLKDKYYAGIDPISSPPYRQLSWCVKLIAFITLLILVSLSALVVLYYGFEFGLRRSITWLLSMIMIFILDVYFIESVHVLIRNFLYFFFSRKKNQKNFCNALLDFNYENQLKYATAACKNRLLKKDMARPLPKKMIKILRTREQKYFEHRKRVVRNVFFIFLFMCLLYLVTHTCQDHAYFHALVYKKMFDEGIYTQTQGLKTIDDNNKILNFINYTLLVATHWRKPHWVMSGDRKVLGRIRLRQIRIRTNLTCLVHRPMTYYASELCHGPFNYDYMDSKNYSSNWTTYNTTEKRELREPYTYHKGEYMEYMTPSFGHTGQIPKGGYYAYLGRSLLSSRKILNRLTKQFWFDLKTRYLIVEFASYSADSNFLTVVKLIIEKSASDSFRTSPHITAIRLRRPLDSSIPHYVGLILIPASYTILITLIWYFYMSDHPPSNLFRYYHQYISFYDLLMIILVFIYTMFFHTLQIAQRTAIRQVGRILISKKFEDFTYLVQILQLTQYLGGFLIFFNVVYLLSFLTFRKILRPYYYSLNLCRIFPSLYIIVIVLGGSFFFWTFGIHAFGVTLKFLVMSLNPHLMDRYFQDMYPYARFPLLWTILITTYSTVLRFIIVFVCIINTRLQYGNALIKHQINLKEERKTYKFSFNNFVRERICFKTDDMDALRKYLDERRFMNMVQDREGYTLSCERSLDERCSSTC